MFDIRYYPYLRVDSTHHVERVDRPISPEDGFFGFCLDLPPPTHLMSALPSPPPNATPIHVLHSFSHSLPLSPASTISSAPSKYLPRNVVTAEHTPLSRIYNQQGHRVFSRSNYNNVRFNMHTTLTIRWHALVGAELTVHHCGCVRHICIVNPNTPTFRKLPYSLATGMNEIVEMENRGTTALSNTLQKNNHCDCY